MFPKRVQDILQCLARLPYIQLQQGRTDVQFYNTYIVLSILCAFSRLADSTEPFLFTQPTTVWISLITLTFCLLFSKIIELITVFLKVFKIALSIFRSINVLEKQLNMLNLQVSENHVTLIYVLPGFKVITRQET